MTTSSRTLDTTASVELPIIDLLTIAEVAALLHCKPWPVLELVRTGRLPSARPVGDAGPRLVHRAALAGLLAAS